MKLNLHILSAFFTGVPTAGQLPEDVLTCTLQGVQLYAPDVPCGADWLYLVPPEESLPDAPLEGVSFFCCAAPAAAPRGASVLWPLEPLTLRRALAVLQEVFLAFQTWESRMEDLLHADAPLRMLGEASIGFLQNPFALYTPSLRQIFHCEPPKPRRLQFFDDTEVDAFLPDEDTLQPGFGGLNVVSVDAESQVLGLDKTVVAPGQLVLQHGGVLHPDAVKIVSLERDGDSAGKGLLGGRQIQKGQLKPDGTVEVIEEITPALKDCGFVLILRELVVDVLELDGLGVVAVCHTADTVRPHLFIGDTVLG